MNENTNPKSHNGAELSADTRDKRRVPFIYQLLKDKMSLTSKCAELCKYVEKVEAAAKARYQKRERVLGEVADAKFQQWKAQYRVRHKKETDRAIEATKAECIEAFKPEVQRLLDRHSAEIELLRKNNELEVEKLRAELPKKASQLAKEKVSHLRRDISQISASKIASIRSQWVDDRRRHEHTQQELTSKFEAREDSIREKHAAEISRLNAEHSAALAELREEYESAARMREAQDKIRNELREQQAHLELETFVARSYFSSPERPTEPH